MMKKFLLLMLFLTMNAEAKYLGTFGHTFDIIEDDLLEVISKKLNTLEKEGVLTQHQSNIQHRIEKQLKRPLPVAGITKTKKSRIFNYDPSIKIPTDLKDHQGNIFVKSGTILNPLNSHQLQSTLIFIDGDDKPQIKWALKQPQKIKIILVNGSPFDLMEFYGRAFYFDQGGKIVKKLGIQQVPARVSQENTKLKIEEIVVEDK